MFSFKSLSPFNGSFKEIDLDNFNSVQRLRHCNRFGKSSRQNDSWMMGKDTKNLFFINWGVVELL